MAPSAAIKVRSAAGGIGAGSGHAALGGGVSSARPAESRKKMGKIGIDPYGTHCWDGPPVAVLWTHSLVWGLLCIDTLSVLAVPFRLLSASEICEDCLDAFRILIVPGGWAAHKVRALGETGRSKIAGFIDEGGSYVGFCGGAGLALSSPPALYLTPIRRMPLSERLPSASGEIYVSGALTHPVWKNIPPQIPVSIWWPSQFRLDPRCEAACLASYTQIPGAGFQVADLRVCDLDESAGWSELERAYGINLDPARIKGHPAIIEVERAKGRLVLSYAHLETPGDHWGNRLFFNILEYLNDVSVISALCGDKGGKTSPIPRPALPAACQGRSGAPSGVQLRGGREAINGERKPVCTACSSSSSGISKAREAAEDLIAFGEANLLWNWRNPWLLNWRRGIRGLEYGALFVTLCYMEQLERKLDREPGLGLQPGACAGGNWTELKNELEEKTLEFCALAKRLLFEEKIAAGTGRVSKLGKVNERVDPLRNALFGNKMNYGGMCAALFDLIDTMTLSLMRAA